MKARHEFESDADYAIYLRTYFAAMAMQGLNPKDYMDSWSDPAGLVPATSQHQYLAQEAVKIADAVIEALNQEAK